MQNSLVFLRLHAAMAREARILKLHADQWENSFDTATSLTEEVSRQQVIRIGNLEEKLQEAWSAKSTAEIELKKQKDATEEATKTIAALIQEVEKANAAEESTKKFVAEVHKAAEES